MIPPVLLAIGLAAALLGGTACSSSSPTPPPPSPGDEVVAPRGGLSVTLLWGPGVDLDLYVTGPDLETVYFANPRSASGGHLVDDATCREGGPEPGPAAPARETVHFPEPPRGRYRVGVDYIDRCGTEESEVGYRLIVHSGGSREEVAGSVRLARFVYQALEFELEGEDGGEAR